MGKLLPLVVLGSIAVGLGACGYDAATMDGDSSGPPPSSRPPEPAASDSAERYSDPGTQPFVMTGHDPLSTFGADVDTASYDIFRRDAAAGRLSDPKSVRLEEYVNSFHYAYEPPSAEGDTPFAIHLAAAPSLFNEGTLLLRVGIQGKVAPPSAANIVFLVDVSGSMDSPDKLPLVKLVLTQSLNVLQPTDRVSIVTYAGYTSVALGPTAASERTTIQPVIDGLGAGGGTAGASGIRLAYDQARAGFIEGGINHVVLCTDGDFNLGISSDAELVSLIETERKSGVTLTTLGFGYGNLNDSMMEKVSDAGNGIYSVIIDADHAVHYANRKLLSTMIHIAKDMKIQVELNSDLVLAYRLLGYEDRAIADDDFRDDLVDGGEVGAGHRVTALYELVPENGVLPEAEGAPAPLDGALYDGTIEVAEGDLALVKVRYKTPGAAESDPAFEVRASLEPTNAAGSYAELDGDFRWAYAVASFAELVKQSPYARPEALPTIADIFHTEGLSNTPDRSEFVALFDKTRPLLERR